MVLDIVAGLIPPRAPSVVGTIGVCNPVPLREPGKCASVGGSLPRTVVCLVLSRYWRGVETHRQLNGPTMCGQL